MEKEEEKWRQRNRGKERWRRRETDRARESSISVL